eukprot:PhF_6_TR5676/c0_g1_i1/m.8358
MSHSFLSLPLDVITQIIACTPTTRTRAKTLFSLSTVNKKTFRLIIDNETMLWENVFLLDFDMVTPNGGLLQAYRNEVIHRGDLGPMLGLTPRDEHNVSSLLTKLIPKKYGKPKEGMLSTLKSLFAKNDSLIHPVTVCVTGLDAAGKSEVMEQWLKRKGLIPGGDKKEFTTQVITIGWVLESLCLSNEVKFLSWDMSLQPIYKKWRPLYHTDGVGSVTKVFVWVVDANDTDRMAVMWTTFWDEVQGVDDSNPSRVVPMPVLILWNKMDAAGVVKVADGIKGQRLHERLSNRHWAIVPISAKYGMNRDNSKGDSDQALKWILHEILSDG